MKITCGDRFIITHCDGCPCHWDSHILMGNSLDEGKCRECGCPKTVEAFEKALTPRCSCGAVIYNNHHCSNGHMMRRGDK